MQGHQYFGAIVMPLGVYCSFLHHVVSHILEQVVRYRKKVQIPFRLFAEFKLIVTHFLCLLLTHSNRNVCIFHSSQQHLFTLIMPRLYKYAKYAETVEVCDSGFVIRLMTVMIFQMNR